MHHSIECHVSARYRALSISPFLLLLLFDAISYIRIACSGKRWFDDFSRMIIWQPEFNKAVEVIQDLRVAKDRCSPVSVDATL